MWSPVSVCALRKVRLQLANITIKIQYTWLVSTVHSSSLHRFSAESRQQDNILGLSSTTILLNGSAHNHLWLHLDKFSSDCFYSYCFFIPCLFRQNSWEVRMTILFLVVHVYDYCSFSYFAAPQEKKFLEISSASCKFWILETGYSGMPKNVWGLMSESF